MKVFKYPLGQLDTATVDLPIGARPLHIEYQPNAGGGEFCLWAMVNPDPELQTEARQFRIAGTGHDLDLPASRYQHINSFLMRMGTLVFHAFEVVP